MTFSACWSHHSGRFGSVRIEDAADLWEAADFFLAERDLGRLDGVPRDADLDQLRPL
jgi:hypothetical protein